MRGTERLDAFQQRHRWLGYPLAVVYKFFETAFRALAGSGARYLAAGEDPRVLAERALAFARERALEPELVAELSRLSTKPTLASAAERL